MKRNKIFALAVIASLSMLIGCGSSDDTNTQSPTLMTGDEDTASQDVVELIPYTSTTVDHGITSTTADSAQDAVAVFTFDGGSIATDSYAYALSQSFYVLETEYFENLQTGELAIEFNLEDHFEPAKAYAVDYLLQIIAMDLILSENNYEMPAELITSVDEYLDYIEAQMGEEDFKGTLDLMGISREGFRNEQIRVDAFDYSVPTIYGKTDEELYASYESDYLKAKHILVQFEFDELGEVSDEAYEIAKNTAEEILLEIEAGEKTFEQLMAEYNQDTSQPDEGYAFTDGYMLEEFENATKLLGVDEISPLVETVYGFHIIKAVPASQENFDANAENIEYIEYYVAADIATETLFARIDALRETLVETDALAEITAVNYQDYYVLD